MRSAGPQKIFGLIVDHMTAARFAANISTRRKEKLGGIKMKINIENKPCFYDKGKPLIINGKPYKHPKATIWVESIQAFVCGHCKREADL